MKGADRTLIEGIVKTIEARSATPDAFRATIRALSDAVSVFSVSAYRAAVQDAFSSDAHRADGVKALQSAVKDPTAFGATYALADARKLALLDRLVERLQHVASQRGIVRAVLVEAATVPTKEEHVALQKMLEKRWGMPVELEVALRPSLIGGWRLRSHDWTLDSSVGGRIKRLASALKHRVIA